MLDLFYQDAEVRIPVSSPAMACIYTTAIQERRKNEGITETDNIHPVEPEEETE